MAVLWAILQILVVFFYKNLHEFNQTNEVNENTGLLVNQSVSNLSESGHDKHNLSSSLYESIRIVDNSETGPLIIRLYNEYIRDEVVAVYSSTFTVFFMQTTLEVT